MMPLARRCPSLVAPACVSLTALLVGCYGGAPGSSADATEPAVTGVGPGGGDGLSSGTGEPGTGEPPTSAGPGGAQGSDDTGAPVTGGGTGVSTSVTTGVTGVTTGVTTDATTGESGESGEPPAPSCGELAAMQGWPAALCEQNGDGACGGQGAATVDCEHCCASPSCGQLAGQLGWGDDALCEQNGDGICKGTGQPTYDCELCCDASGLPTGGFGYPVGDLSTYPAGGWSIGQVMAHYYDAYGGRHLAHDVNHPNGGVATINAPVHSVADGVVRYAGPNSSSYKHIVLIEHAVAGEDPVCSFYGHVNAPVVATGDVVKRGQQVTSVMDWNLILGGSGNTHLHYGIVRKSLCDASAAAKGALLCGYDEAGPNGVVDLASEPYSYQPVADLCGDSNYGDVFISPTKFIEAHHF